MLLGVSFARNTFQISGPQKRTGGIDVLSYCRSLTEIEVLFNTKYFRSKKRAPLLPGQKVNKTYIGLNPI
jgi:hypothetical protein